MKRTHEIWTRHSDWCTEERIADHLTERIEAIKDFSAHLWRKADWLDPLRRWTDLVFHLKWDERERLEGTAYLAHVLKDMALLLGRLLEYAGEGEAWGIVDPGSVTWMKRRLGGVIDDRDVGQKEFVANRFGLNSRPRCVWFVEGDSELDAIQLLDREKGYGLARVGVRVRSIHGTGNIKNLPLAIETAEAAGSLVLLLVDKGDQGVGKLVRRLILAGRLNADQVYYSSPDFEEHNFSDAENEALAKWARLRRARKPRRASVGTRAFVVSETRRGVRERPIVKQYDDVLLRAWKHGQDQPMYHPNIRPPSGES